MSIDIFVLTRMDGGRGGVATGNKNKGKGNGAGLASESQSHYFADDFLIAHAHSSRENCRIICRQ